MSFFESLVTAQGALLTGFLNTIAAAFFAIVIGTTLGILIGFILTYGNKYIKIPFRLYVDIMRGIPGLVTLFAIYFLVGFLLQGFGIGLTPLGSGIIALSALACADVAEVTRGALQSIHKGQIEAGKAIGLRFRQIFIHILFPQALVQMIPPWINTATEVVKGSTLLALVGVSELLLTANQLVAVTGRALPYYLFIGLIFFLLNSLIQYFGGLLEQKVSFEKR
jgi:polar amino acid transport system permease protein